MKGINFKRAAIAIGIAIVFNLFINYGIEVFYPGPEYDDYCNYSAKPVPAYLDGRECPPFQESKELRDSCEEQKGYIEYEYNASGCAVNATCNTCSAEFNAVREPYDANIFIVLVAIGVAALVGGVLVKTTAVGTGFMLGGILSILIGTLRNWFNFTDMIRFVILGLVLALLVWIGLKKLK